MKTDLARICADQYKVYRDGEMARLYVGSCRGNTKYNGTRRYTDLARICADQGKYRFTQQCNGVINTRFLVKVAKDWEERQEYYWMQIGDLKEIAF
jgi:hypothetical protein